MAESKDKNNNSQEEKPEEVTKETEEIHAEKTDVEKPDTSPDSDSDDAGKKAKPDGKVVKFACEYPPMLDASKLKDFSLFFVGFKKTWPPFSNLNSLVFIEG